MRLVIIIIMLFGIGLVIDRISHQLADIRVQLVMANCLSEAKQGVRCPEMKR